MIGDLIITPINGQGSIDAFTQYGVSIAEDGYNQLIEFNQIKSPPTNDWAEEHGIEVDLSDIKLENKTIQIDFFGVLEFGLESFIGLLSDYAYYDFSFVEAGITRRLRLISMPDRQTIQPHKIFSLEFADDSYPFDGYVRQDPIRIDSCWQTGYNIDDISLSDYGIWVSGDMEDRIISAPNVKENLLIDTQGINGALYDYEGGVRFSSKDVTITCNLHTDKDTFWRNWNAFFYDLTRAGEHRFYYDERQTDYPVYYKSCSVSRFVVFPNEIWCDFEVTLTFITLSIGDIEVVLGSEIREVIITEDGTACIDVNNRIG